MNIRKKIFFSIGLCCVVNYLFAQNVLISTPKTSLVLFAPIGGDLKYVYYGTKLSDTDLQTISRGEKNNLSAYPAYGLNCPSE